tara:strand:- start:669 stop:1064 length:396 start_codon:yes stop_codon:yes gene_type:complete
MIGNDKDCFKHISFGYQEYLINNKNLNCKVITQIIRDLDHPVNLKLLGELIKEYLARDFLLTCENEIFINYLFAHGNIDKIREIVYRNKLVELRQVFPLLIVQKINIYLSKELMMPIREWLELFNEKNIKE